MKQIHVQGRAYRCGRCPELQWCSACGFTETFRVSPCAGADTCTTTNRIENQVLQMHALCERNAGDPWLASSERFWRAPPKVRATQRRIALPEKPRTRSIDAGGRTALLRGRCHDQTAQSNSACVPRTTRAYRDWTVRISSVFRGRAVGKGGGSLQVTKTPARAFKNTPRPDRNRAN